MVRRLLVSSFGADMIEIAFAEEATTMTIPGFCI